MTALVLMGLAARALRGRLLPEGAWTVVLATWPSYKAAGQRPERTTAARWSARRAPVATGKPSYRLVIQGLGGERPRAPALCPGSGTPLDSFAGKQVRIAGKTGGAAGGWLEVVELRAGGVEALTATTRAWARGLCGCFLAAELSALHRGARPSRHSRRGPTGLGPCRSRASRRPDGDGP